MPAVLKEYALNAVTEGIDAIATTRVVISGDGSHTSTHALTGQAMHRTFRSSFYSAAGLSFLRIRISNDEWPLLFPVEAELPWIL